MYILISIVTGILFGFMDGLINANVYAQKYLAVYKPILKTSINIPVGVAIDLVYGFILTWIFSLLYHSLPGESGIIKGLSYGILISFFRVVMSSASHWMMFKISFSTVVYSLLTGLGEMLVLGILLGLTIKPK